MLRRMAWVLYNVTCNYDYDLCVRSPPPPPPHPEDVPIAISDHSKLSFVVPLAIAAVLFVPLCALAFLCYRRCCCRRQRLHSVENPASAPVTNGPAGAGAAAAADGEDPDWNLNPEEIHHVWYIRTVGLDEATIASIAAAEYREGVGLLGSGGGDCAVCLGEFRDGDWVRLLPKCGHAFHVHCIDTWLRAHVNCPLCRAAVVDPPGIGSSSLETRGDAGGDDPESAELPDAAAHGIEMQRLSSDGHSGAPLPIRRAVSTGSAAFLDLQVVVVPNEDCCEDGSKEADVKEEGAAEEGDTRRTEIAARGSGRPGFWRFGRSLSSSGGIFFFSRNGRRKPPVLPH